MTRVHPVGRVGARPQVSPETRVRFQTETTLRWLEVRGGGLEPLLELGSGPGPTPGGTWVCFRNCLPSTSVMAVTELAVGIGPSPREVIPRCWISERRIVDLATESSPTPFSPSRSTGELSSYSLSRDSSLPPVAVRALMAFIEATQHDPPAAAYLFCVHAYPRSGLVESPFVYPKTDALSRVHPPLGTKTKARCCCLL